MCTCFEYPCSPARNGFAVENKHARRVNLDDFKDDAEEEVRPYLHVTLACCDLDTFTFLSCIVG